MQSQRRKTPAERKAEKELKEHLVDQAIHGTIWIVTHAWRFLANLAAAVFAWLCTGPSWDPVTAFTALAIGYAFFPVMRWISDRMP